MTNESAKRLLDARDACRTIVTFTQGVDFAAYESNQLLRLAVERLLEIVGEAFRWAALEHPDLALEIPALRQIIALRNRIAHNYDGIDEEIVWDVAQNHIPILELELSSILVRMQIDY